MALYDAYDLMLMSEAESEGMVSRVTKYRATWDDAAAECILEGRSFETVTHGMLQENIFKHYFPSGSCADGTCGEDH